MHKKNQSQNSRRSFIRNTSLGTASIALSPLLIEFLSGCNKDFLERKPLDAITDVSFWETADQLKLAVNGCYAYLKGKNTIDMENMGDNTIWPSSTAYREISSGTYDADLGTVNSEWSGAYTGIHRCNHFLENYKKAQNIEADVMDQLVGEVRFLRAYLYSYLSFLFGDVPLITKTLNIGDAEIFGKRTDRKEVVDFILVELDDASQNLPLNYSASDYGRITKGAALAWKSRVALFYSQWDVAEAAAKAVMDLGVYELYSNGDPDTSYWELFTYNGQASQNPNNKESILVRVYTPDISTHNMSREVQVPDQTARWNPTKPLADSYLCTDGKPIGKSSLYMKDSYTDVFKNRDPRMGQTILAPGSPWEGLDDGDPDNKPNAIFESPKFKSDKKGCVTFTGYYFTKYVEPTAVPTYRQDENDTRITRYAEILLDYAEARLEQGTLTQGDIDMTINKLRERVGMHSMNIAELEAWGMDIREEIRRERRVELALEGQRYFDILRWKQGDLLAADVKGIKKEFAPDQSYVASVNTDADGYMIVQAGRIFNDPKNYLWPVPLIQTQRNPKLGQNPGW